VYGLETIPTFYRGTLRRSGYCQHWNVLVNLGITDDSFVMQDSETLTPRNFVNAFLPFDELLSVEEKFLRFANAYGIDSLDRFEWLGLFDGSQPIGLKDATPAQLLEHVLVGKWVLEPEDKDMLVMVHLFEYELNGEKHTIESSMVNIGEDQVFTSMSNLVGLPIAMCAKHMLNGELKDTGVHVPTSAHVYAPILAELAEYGVCFTEKESVASVTAKH
jgi:saccharopine dehydrogenase-like NADP-dependent oxidoreductase